MEIMQGQFRRTLPSTEHVLGATKWCVFKHVTVSRPLVMNAVRERMDRMGTTSVDLLQVCSISLSGHEYSDKIRNWGIVPLARLYRL